jgi:large repetitive protein
VNIANGGSTASSTVIVDFQGTVAGKGSHIDLKIDNGKWEAVKSPHKIPRLSDGTHTIYARTVDKAGNVDPTPAHWKFTVNKQAGRDHPSETWINSVRTPDGKNIPNGGSTTSKVVTVDFQSTATDTGKGSHVDLKIDNGRYKAVASPKTITGLSVGKHTIYLKGVDKYGNEDPTPAKWTFTVIKGGGFPETWINWVRATPKGVNIADGGSTPSSTVIVDFQGTVSGRGSHIDLKIDNGPYEPVASRHKIPWLSDGNTIYLKAVDKDGKADPTPAKWRFTVR